MSSPKAKNSNNKKVLLRERKRHTGPQEGARCWPPRPAGPDPPLGWLTWPPLAGWPDPPAPPGRLTDLTPPSQLDLTPPSQLDLTPPRQLTDLIPPPVDKLTKWNYYLPVVLRTRAVMKCCFDCVYFHRHTDCKWCILYQVHFLNQPTAADGILTRLTAIYTYI